MLKILDHDLSKYKLSHFDDLDIKVKDCSRGYIEKYVPKELRDLCSTVTSLINTSEHRFMTFDIFLSDYQKGQSSCVDPSWHVDGKPGYGNEYYMFQLGGHRTIFKINGRESEVPEGVLLRYDSNDVHRGRIFKYNDRRLMLRICLSNYIRPRNKRF